MGIAKGVGLGFWLRALGLRAQRVHLGYTRINVEMIGRDIPR